MIAINLYHTEPRFKNLVEMLTAHALNEDFTIEELELAIEVVRENVRYYRSAHPEWAPITLEERRARDKAAVLNARIGINFKWELK